MKISFLNQCFLWNAWAFLNYFKEPLVISLTCNNFSLLVLFCNSFIEESKPNKIIFSKQKPSITYTTCRLQGNKSQGIIFSVMWYQFPLSWLIQVCTSTPSLTNEVSNGVPQKGSTTVTLLQYLFKGIDLAVIKCRLHTADRKNLFIFQHFI